MKATAAVTPPRLIKQVDPKFPKRFQMDGKTYVVTIHLTIDQNGLPANATVLTPASADELNQSALTAVKKYRFTPVIFEGKPVAVELNVAVNFSPPPQP